MHETCTLHNRYVAFDGNRFDKVSLIHLIHFLAANAQHSKTT